MWFKIILKELLMWIKVAFDLMNIMIASGFSIKRILSYTDVKALNFKTEHRD